MNDAIDAGMDNAESEEEASKVYQQICDEIGVGFDEEHEVARTKVNVEGQASTTGPLVRT